MSQLSKNLILNGSVRRFFFILKHKIGPKQPFRSIQIFKESIYRKFQLINACTRESITRIGASEYGRNL